MEQEEFPIPQLPDFKTESMGEMHKGMAINLIPKHAHRWRIEEANGPTSMGCCKGCGAEKEFRNWLQDTDFITNEEHRTGLGNL